MKKQISVITGAANGIGYEYAKQVASEFQFDQIWIVDFDQQSLDDAVKQIPKSVAFCLDLTKQSDIAVLKKNYAQEDVDVVLFVNNAGIGKMGLFIDAKKTDNLRMIDLNVRAVTELAYDVIPYMKKDSTLVQVSSIASFIPMSHYPVYGATKAYVSYFTTILSVQLKERGIHVQLLCPPATRTKFFISASDNKFEMDPVLPNFFVMTAQQVVTHSIRSVKRHRFLSSPNWFWRFVATYFRFLSYIRLSPLRMMTRFWKSNPN